MGIRLPSLVLLSLVAASACDLEAGAGQELVLDNRGLALASVKPNAVTVLPGGSVVVQDADVFGRGRSVSADTPDLQLEAGAAIAANAGRVRIVQGQLSGGNFLIASGRQAGSARIGTLAPALQAVAGSTVEILGGTLVSSGVFFASGVTDDNTLFDFPETVSVSDSDLRIRGGVLRAGERQDMISPPGFPALGLAFPLDATRSRVEISGGDFGPGSVQLRGSRSRILGGRMDRLTLSPAPPATNSGSFDFVAGCTEIRGGSFGNVTITGAGERLIVFGSGFNRPLGPLPGGTPVVAIQLSGTLEAGNFATFFLGMSSGTQVSLAAPGSPGCP
jgi:hypothetical protein